MSYTPSLHTLSAKPLGISQPVPTDARSYFYDEENFVYRAYVNMAEALAYLDTSAKRTGQFSIIINTGGTVVDGVITGGTNTECWFKDGTTDGDLIVKYPSFTIDSVPTNGSSNAVSSDGVFDALTTKQPTLTFDSTPTSISTNPVTSGGVFTALGTKQSTLTLTTTGTSGAASLIGNTLNIPNYATGSGGGISALTSGTIPVATSSTTIGDSPITIVSGNAALRNLTAATSSVQQSSPKIVLEGQGWASTGSVSQSAKWETFTTPIAGGALTTSTLYFNSVINNGSSTTPFRITNAGQGYFLSSINAPLINVTTSNISGKTTTGLLEISTNKSVVGDSIPCYIANYDFGATNYYGAYIEVDGTGGRRIGIFSDAPISIGNPIPAISAALDITSTTQGLLLPRMTKVQRDAIVTPVAGLAVYQTDNTPGLRCYNGTNWIKYSETTD